MLSDIKSIDKIAIHCNKIRITLLFKINFGADQIKVAGVAPILACHKTKPYGIRSF